MSSSHAIRLNLIRDGIATVTDIHSKYNLEMLRSDLRALYKFPKDMLFTIKWIDDENDACTISSEMELVEAFQILKMTKEQFITMLVFNGIPENPGMLCPDEDVKMYRRGAKRWNKKLYHLKGHNFVARRFNPNATCFYCQGRIWGLGRQGYRCMECRLLIHQRCKASVTHQCGEDASLTQIQAQRAVMVDSSGLPGALVEGYQNQGFIGVEPSSEAVARSLPASEQQKQPLSGEGHLLLPEVPLESDKIGLAHFKLLQVIGRGSYAKVFQVEYIPSGKLYAMKVIKKEIITNEEDIDWVQTEKHVFECATNHPFLVGLHSCFQTPSRLFFVIEFVRGGDLMYHMQRKLRLPEEYARFYAAEICIALNFLHERGIIYRDLKLDNVLMDCEGHIKLTDYGMCKEGVFEDVTTSTFCGTPNYIAPEILRRENYSFSVDWWALGVLMFEMLAGRSPWEGVGQSDNPDQNTEEYLFQVILTRPIRFPRSISVQANNLLQRFLNKNPLERLGCQPDSNFADIMNQPMFRTIDWVALEQKRIQPPYRPEDTEDKKLIHFDATFTNEPVIFTPDNTEAISRIDQSEFDGFEYVNPLLVQIEASA